MLSLSQFNFISDAHTPCLCSEDQNVQTFAEDRYGTFLPSSIFAKRIQSGLQNVVSKISERYNNPTLATMALATGLAMAIYQIFSIIDEDMIPISLKKIFILDETEKWFKNDQKC